MKNKGYLALAIVVIGLIVCLGVYFYTQKDKTDTPKEEETACKYTNEQLQEFALDYFVSINGKEADNGEEYIAATETLENNEVLVAISHLQNDHSTTDARYTINCNTGVGTDDMDESINFVK